MYIVSGVMSFACTNSKGVSKRGGGGWGAEAPQILSSCYEYKQLPQRNIQNIEKQLQKEKTAFRL